MENLSLQTGTALLRPAVTGGVTIAPRKETIKKPPVNQVAHFFKKEYKLALAAFWTRASLGLLLLAGSAAACLALWLTGQPLWLIGFPGTLGAAALALTTVVLVGFLSLKNELRTININSDARVVLPGLTKIYRRLATRGVTTNWLCAGVYLFGGLAVLFTAIVVWAINLAETGRSDFGSLVINGGDHAPLYVVYALAAVLCVAFIYHVTMTLLRQWRVSRIDTFYGFQLVAQAEIEEIRRFKNKRSRFVFFGLLIVTFFFFWLAYRLILKGRALKTAK